MSKYRVVYLRDHKGQPVGCIATELKRNSLGGFAAAYQYSVLNPRDQFQREIARTIAKGRLTERPLSVQLPDLPSNHEITRVIMNELVNNQGVPTRARKAAQLWLRNSKKMEEKFADEIERNINDELTLASAFNA